MALYNTLFSFPFSVPHGTGDDSGGALAVPAATMIRWYWRVRRWKMTISADAITATSHFHMYRVGHVNTEIADETRLLFPSDLTPTDGSGALWLFHGDPYGSSADTVFTAATQTYLWAGVSGGVSLTSGYGGRAYFYHGATPTQDGDAAIIVPVTIDGLTCAFPGVVGAVDPDHPPTSHDLSCAITPAEYWGWGGKYDTTTGERL